MMERPKSTRSLQSCSPSSFPASVSVTPHGMRRSHRTPNTNPTEAEVGSVFARLAEPRLSPHQPRVVTEAATPRLAAAVAEAKRSGAAAPSPAQDTPAPMDQFDRLLAQNLANFNASPSPTPAVHIHGREADSPAMLKAVHTVLADEARRKDVMAQIARIISDTALKAGTRNTPRGPHTDRTVEPLYRLARAVRDVSPPDVSGRQRHTPRERGGTIDRELPKAHHFDPSDPIRSFTKDPVATPAPIYRPTPSERRLSKAQLMQLQSSPKPSKKKVIRSSTSDFVETNTDETGSIESSRYVYQSHPYGR
jgi:hypothetical protein